MTRPDPLTKDERIRAALSLAVQHYTAAEMPKTAARYQAVLDSLSADEQSA